MNEHGVLELDELTQSSMNNRNHFDFVLFIFFSADQSKPQRSSQALLDDEWEPEPIEALTGSFDPFCKTSLFEHFSFCLAPERALRPSHSRDLMSMLVSIYGHAELFIEEYVHMLADRMLSGQSNKVHIDNENRYVDILKQRFGDAGLQGCDVMLRDFADSSVINQLVQKELKTDPCATIPINTLIISREYWPEVKFSPIELPKQLTTIQDAFTKAYEGLKSHRTLHWSPNYGKNLVIELNHWFH